MKIPWTELVTWFGWGLFAWWIWQLWPLGLGVVRGGRFPRIPPIPPEETDLPLVSVIVPARDESAAIETTLLKLMAVDYPRYEVIAIDDRSIDGTGEIMDRVAGTDGRLRVIHVRELPPGWLGKNHANWLAARQAGGEYLLFTDGDVQFDPSILRRAIAVIRRERLDHLVLLPDFMPGGFWEAALMNHFALLFGIVTRFPLARFRWARNAYIGVGAFNMVRRGAYEAIGTHERLRLEVADDLMLGKLIKQAGFAQDAMLGAPFVRVRWQTGVWGIIRGLEKNAFAGARYSVPLVVLAVVSQVSLMIGQTVLALTGPGRLPFGLSTGLLVAALLATARSNRLNPLVAFTYPVTSILFSYAVARSAAITLRAGGVTWRDTFYPLEELRRFKV